MLGTVQDMRSSFTYQGTIAQRDGLWLLCAKHNPEPSSG